MTTNTYCKASKKRVTIVDTEESLIIYVDDEVAFQTDVKADEEDTKMNGVTEQSRQTEKERNRLNVTKPAGHKTFRYRTNE